MSISNSQKSNDELLKELLGDQEEKHKSACELLANIKSNTTKIENLLQNFLSEEPDLVYRFYHQSFKVFIMTSLIEQADNLFKNLAPESAKMNAWYRLIAKTAMTRKFEGTKTNEKWIGETTPLLLAFWNARYFLEQMLVASVELDEPPQMLPSGWAAVLYLYNLR